MEMLELRDLHKTFNPGTVNEKVALNGVSLTMEAGDFATIVGSNGAGKSTLFNSITGGFIADEGSITLGGEDITFAPEYQRSRVIGHLFQDPLKGTAPNMTIEENLALAYLRAGTAPNAIFSRISRKDKEIFREKLALLDMGLEDRMKQPVGLLSGGQDHLPDGHPQYASGIGAGQPHPHDGRRPHRLRCQGRGPQQDDRGRPAREVPRERRQGPRQ